MFAFVSHSCYISNVICLVSYPMNNKKKILG